MLARRHLSSSCSIGPRRVRTGGGGGGFGTPAFSVASMRPRAASAKVDILVLGEREMVEEGVRLAASVVSSFLSAARS